MNIQELFACLEKKIILVTPNRRLAQYFEERYFCYQHSKNVSVFEKPAIFSYEVWLEKIWITYGKKLYENLTLLTPIQSSFLWEEVIKKDSSFFFGMQGLMDEAKNAWKLCHAWGVSIEKQQFFSETNNIDVKKFFKWATNYKNILTKNQWIDFESLPTILNQSSFLINDEIIITGFDHLPKSIEALFKKNRFYSIYENNNKSKKINKASFISEEEEINAFIHWAREHKGKKIGCVISDINGKRKKIERFLQSHFDAEEYTISIGHALNEISIIVEAIKALTLPIQKNLTLKDFYFFLNSRYFNMEDEKQAKAMKTIYASENEMLSWKSFIKVLHEEEISFGKSLEAFVSKKLYKKMKPSHWSSFFKEQLTVLNWPGSSFLNVVEENAYLRWLKLLKEYCQFDLIFSEITYDKAIDLLIKIAQKTTFQVQEKKSTIHLMGFLEASGLNFELCWIMGMNKENFPANVQFNAFIPHNLQKKFHMPHVTHEIEAAFSQKLMQHFEQSGQEVVFSYLSQKDNLPAFESPLIQNIPFILMKKEEKRQLEFIENMVDSENNIPCISDEKIKGGTTLLKNQALCPFRAFARHRLQALSFGILSKGLNNRDQGNLVHETLEKFWKKIQTKQVLMTYTNDSLKKLIRDIVHQVTQAFFAKKPDAISPFFQSIEASRLEQLLTKWIDFEKTRPDFSIHSLEKKQIIKLSELELHVRSDRIDRLPNGDKMVIDYKTGILPAISTIDDRPENPQLILYALSDNNIRALAFAQVKPVEPCLKGKAAHEMNISGIYVVPWDEEREIWSQQLTMLADEFIQGKHTVAPKKESTCDSCDLHGICRIRDFTGF